MAEYLALKWGTIKEWRLDEDSPAFEALQRFGEVSDGAGAMMESGNKAQKDAICELIDALDAETVHLEWCGKDVSKEDAKLYVRTYQH